jgi:RNA polymerase sigma-70 factor (ECF subfamily)
VAVHHGVPGDPRPHARRGRRRSAASPDAGLDADTDALPDERLQLVLLCCHPALDPASRSALALRLVLGTTTDEIARLFLVPTPTMAARITRAKRKIAVAGIPLARPVGDELDTRLDAVARTVYLAFTAGYAPGSGSELLRTDVAGEAVRLAELLHRLVPAAPQPRALLALLLFQHARRSARVDAGELVTLADQDRSRWRHDEIDAAVRLLDAMPVCSGYAEELRLQAAAAREHAVAPSSAATDWAAIAALYDDLERRTGSPVVRLNRAVAVAEVEGPEAGLALLAALDDPLGRTHRFHATRADLARRAGDRELALDAYRRAIALCGNEVERTFLTARLDSIS